MTTAIIGTGAIGSRLARQLAAGGERVVIAGQDAGKAQVLADEVGPLADAASVPDAIKTSDTVIFAVWLDTIQDLLTRYADSLPGKIVVDPSNPLRPDGNGGLTRTLPDDQSAGALVASLVPEGAYFVKAFGTLGAESLSADANRRPERAVLFYATDDPAAEPTIERLINATGFTPLKAGGVKASGRIEVGGDLHQFGGFQGKAVGLAEAEAGLTGQS